MNSDRPVVSLVPFEGDHVAAVGRTLELCGASELFARGQKVLLKPNFHGGQGYTSMEVLRALTLWLQSRGAGEIVIGDGPYFGCRDARPYYRDIGILDLAEQLGVRFVNLHDHHYRLLRPGSPHAPEEIGISSLFYWADVVVSVPLMKTHFGTAVTLGLKNLKGLLRPEDKRAFHELELNAAIIELNALVQPDVTLLDAVRPVEGMGPSAGDPLEMGLILASRDTVAVDAVAAHLMGYDDPAEVRLIRGAAQRGIGVCDLERIKVAGEALAAHRRRFKRPFETLAEQFPELSVNTDGACSGCTMNFFTALRDNQSAGVAPPRGTVKMGLGEPPQGALLIGQCTRDFRQGHEFVPGCPPRVSQIQEALRKLS